jgi:O-Antigen ligase
VNSAVLSRAAPVPLVGALAGATGWLVAVKPGLALAIAGLAAAFVLAFLFPVAHLAILLVLVAIVPFEAQNVYGLGGGRGQAGLVASDVFLLSGFVRAMWVLPRERLHPAALAAALLTIVFLLVSVAQFAHGLSAGHSPAAAGTELRSYLGFAAVLIAMPLTLDHGARRRLMGAMLAVGLALGLWGVAQWVFGVSFGETGDVGIREGVEQTTAGRGQLLGGLFGFPVCVIVGFAALLAGEIRSLLVRAGLVAVVALNGVCLLLTYERTFWVVTAAACALVALRAGRIHRWRALVWATVVTILVLLPLAVLAPRDLGAAGERLLSLRQYSADTSVSYRLIESEHVVREIDAQPAGAGLGATIYWGRPDRDVPAQEQTFSHNGFLRVAWKLGIPAAVLLVGGLAAACVRRRPRGAPPVVAAYVNGCQAALFALLAVSVTFPSITALSSTAVQGTLVAVALTRGQPLLRRLRHPPAALHESNR